MLKWKDKEGFVLTEEATHKSFTYLVFWGTMTESYFGRIYENGKLIDETNEGNPNYGLQRCKGFCERHARAQSRPKIPKIMTPSAAAPAPAKTKSLFQKSMDIIRSMGKRT